MYETLHVLLVALRLAAWACTPLAPAPWYTTRRGVAHLLGTLTCAYTTLPPGGLPVPSLDIRSCSLLRPTVTRPAGQGAGNQEWEQATAGIVHCALCSVHCALCIVPMLTRSPMAVVWALHADFTPCVSRARLPMRQCYSVRAVHRHYSWTYACRSTLKCTALLLFCLWQPCRHSALLYCTASIAGFYRSTIETQCNHKVQHEMQPKLHSARFTPPPGSHMALFPGPHHSLCRSVALSNAHGSSCQRLSSFSSLSSLSSFESALAPFSSLPLPRQQAQKQASASLALQSEGTYRVYDDSFVFLKQHRRKAAMAWAPVAGPC